MQLLPKRNYAEMLIILLVTILYSLCPADLKQALGISESLYMQVMGLLLLAVMLLDVAVMSYWRSWLIRRDKMETRRSKPKQTVKRWPMLSWLVTFIMVFSLAITFLGWGLKTTAFNVNFAKQEVQTSGLNKELATDLMLALDSYRSDLGIEPGKLLTKQQINEDIILAVENFYAGKKTILDTKKIAEQVATNMDNYLQTGELGLGLNANSERYLALKSTVTTGIQEKLAWNLGQNANINDVQTEFMKAKQIVDTLFKVGLTLSIILAVILVLLQGLRPFNWAYYLGLAGCWATVPFYLLLWLLAKYQIYSSFIPYSARTIAIPLEKIAVAVTASLQATVFAGVIVALGLLILGIIGMRFQQKVGHYGIHMAKRR